MQTVNEARYTFWHTVIDLWQASDKPKDEWCWENKLPLKTFVHYEGIFRRQKARGYVYGKMDRMDSNKEPLEQGRTGIPVKDDSGNSDRPQKSSAASAYVEIPMPGAECQEPVTKPSDPRMPGKKRRETAMGIVTQYHRDTDTTYVYESESYYDPSRKQSRSRRKLIGKLDKETGEVIPTGKRGPKKKERAASGTPAAGGNPEEAPALRERILELEKEVQILRSRVKVLTDENRAIGEAKAESERLKLENRRMEGLISSIRKLVT